MSGETPPQHRLFGKYHGAGNDFVCIDERRGGFLHRLTAFAKTDPARLHRRPLPPPLRDRRRRAHPPARRPDSRRWARAADGLLQQRRCAVKLLWQRLALLPGLRAGVGRGRRPGPRDAPVGGRVRGGRRLAPRRSRGGYLPREHARPGWGSAPVRERRPRGDGITALRTLVCRFAGGRHHRGRPRHPLRGAFAKTGINVNYVAEGPDGLAIRTYERGVEGETLACGTGVTAAALSFAERRQLKGAQRIEVRARGGQLAVEFERAASGAISGVVLEGPAVRSFRGHISRRTLAEAVAAIARATDRGSR